MEGRCVYRQSANLTSLSHHCRATLSLQWQFSKWRVFPAGVSYLLAPKACVSFGDKSNSFVIDFEEESKGGTGMIEMLMQNLAASGSEEVRNQVKDRLS